MGRTGFVERHGLWSGDDADIAARVVRDIADAGLEVVRLSWPDQHGILRGKTVMASEAEQAMRNGCAITTTLLAKDTSHATVFPVFSPGGGFGIPEMENAGDFVGVPVPSSFRVLPWAPKTGWMLCDAYLSDGTPVPFSTRAILKKTLDEVAAEGFDYVAGIEVECHIYKLEDARLDPSDAGQPGAPPEVSLLAHGFHYLTEQRFDQLDPVFEFLRRDLLALGLPLRTLESEFGPSQFEFTLAPAGGLQAADNMMLFRSAVKQICRRHGYHATFMCRPGLPNAFASGWHLHQSLAESASGTNLFMPADGDAPLSETGQAFLAGLLEHALAGTVFTTPTVNGYRRFQPNSLAPDRVSWGVDHRGSLMRVIGGAGDPATRIENRAGEPAANPYLFIAAQIAAGLDGIERKPALGPSDDEPYQADRPLLPADLATALAALGDSRFYRETFGDVFVDYYRALKQAELDRYAQYCEDERIDPAIGDVTGWEQNEYYDFF